MKRLLCISDLHALSLWGLMPKRLVVEDIMTGEEIAYLPNKTQKKILKRWNEMIKKVGRVDACLVNGDAIDGTQYRSMGKGVVSTDIGVQTEAAIQLLQMVDTDKFYLTQGTEYHTMQDRPVEQYMAERLGGEYGPDIIIKIDGKRLHAYHKIGFSRSVWHYRTTPLARDMLLATLHNAEEEYGHLDGVIRSHVHYYTCVEIGSQVGVITPGWQNRTPYSVKAGIMSPPEIGYVLLEFEDDEINVKKKRWKIGPICREVVVDG